MNFYENYLNSIIKIIENTDDPTHKVVEDNLPTDSMAIMTLLDHADMWDDTVDPMYEGESLYRMMRDLLYRKTLHDVFTKLA